MMSVSKRHSTIDVTHGAMPKAQNPHRMRLGVLSYPLGGNVDLPVSMVYACLMAMTITWNLNIGPVNWTVPDDKVMDSVKAVQALGFDPVVTIPKEK